MIGGDDEEYAEENCLMPGDKIPETGDVPLVSEVNAGKYAAFVVGKVRDAADDGKSFSFAGGDGYYARIEPGKSFTCGSPDGAGVVYSDAVDG